MDPQNPTPPPNQSPVSTVTTPPVAVQPASQAPALEAHLSMGQYFKYLLVMLFGFAVIIILAQFVAFVVLPISLLSIYVAYRIAKKISQNPQAGAAESDKLKFVALVSVGSIFTGIVYTAVLGKAHPMYKFYSKLFIRLIIPELLLGLIIGVLSSSS